MKNRVHSLLVSFLRFIIRGYQWFISPLLGQNCRFHPSCSHYLLLAIETHGFVIGGYLGLRRLLKCHPWHPGGHDPVPTKSDVQRPCCTKQHKPSVSPPP